MSEVMDYSERLMRAMLADLPDGEGHFEDFCDGDGIPDDARGPRRAVLDPHAREEGAATALTVDFAGSDPAGQGPHQRAAVGDRIGRLLRRSRWRSTPTA